MHCGTKEFRAYCRPTETVAGPSDARLAAAASHFIGVFLACAWRLELSRAFKVRIPIGSVDVGTTTTLLAARALPNNCTCVHLNCQHNPASPLPALL